MVQRVTWEEKLEGVVARQLDPALGEVGGEFASASIENVLGRQIEGEAGGQAIVREFDAPRFRPERRKRSKGHGHHGLVQHVRQSHHGEQHGVPHR